MQRLQEEAGSSKGRGLEILPVLGHLMEHGEPLSGAMPARFRCDSMTIMFAFVRLGMLKILFVLD